MTPEQVRDASLRGVRRGDGYAADEVETLRTELEKLVANAPADPAEDASVVERLEALRITHATDGDRYDLRDVDHLIDQVIAHLRTR